MWIISREILETRPRTSLLFFIFKNNESAAYLQGQRDFMRLLLVSSPWSKKWSNTLAGWVCRILKSTIRIELSKIHKALRNGFLYCWPFWCVYLTQTNLRMNQNIQNHSYISISNYTFEIVWLCTLSELGQRYPNVGNKQSTQIPRFLWHAFSFCTIFLVLLILRIFAMHTPDYDNQR